MWIRKYEHALPPAAFADNEGNEPWSKVKAVRTAPWEERPQVLTGVTEMLTSPETLPSSGLPVL